MCDFALQSAPNVLFGRYKQYGQVHKYSIDPAFFFRADDSTHT
jgi:hypothetical protein